MPGLPSEPPPSPLSPPPGHPPLPPPPPPPQAPLTPPLVPLSPIQPPQPPPPSPPASDQQVDAPDASLIIPVRPWEDTDDIADPLDSDELLPTVLTRLVASGRDGSVASDYGAVINNTAYNGDSLQVTSQLFRKGNSTVIRQLNNGGDINIPDADHPTPVDQPWVLRYSIITADGPKALPKLRIVHIDCPQGERRCDEEESSDGRLKCSVEGICGDLVAETTEADNQERTSPTLGLEGKESIQITQGASYRQCNSNSEQGTCDRGVIAEDTVEGDISGSVEITCFYQPPNGDKEEEPRAEPINYTTSNLRECGLDTSLVGTWFMTYKVSNNVGMASTPESVTRELLVQADCEAGRVVCSSGTCAADELQCTDFSDEEDEAAVPDINLLPVQGTTGSSSFVRVPRFSEYVACSQLDEEDRNSTLCEPGATAASGDGEDLTSEVLACPPQSCLDDPSQCSFSMRFSASGISGCQFNLSAEVGSLFPLVFAVYNDYDERALITRTLDVSDPCEDSTGSYYCDGECVEVQCSLLPQLNRRPPEAAPNLRLLFFGRRPVKTPLLIQFLYGWEEGVVSPDSGGDGSGLVGMGGSKRLLLGSADSVMDGAEGGVMQRAGGAQRLLLQQEQGDLLASSTDKRTLAIAYAFPANSSELDGTGWANPFTAPCLSEDRTQCGVIAEDFLGNKLSVMTLSPCTEDLSGLSWEEWKARIVEANDNQDVEQRDLCPGQSCSPSAVDRGQCPPGRYGFRYLAEDTSRSNNVTVFFRIEHASEHALNLTVALDCSDGPEALKGQVDALGVDTSLPYMTQLGLQQYMVRQVRLLGPIAVNFTEAHPGTEDGMPPLCLASMELDIQVGCTPEDEGFSGGPAGEETEGQWCPCDVAWDQEHQDAAPQLNASQAYAVDRLFGPLVSFSLRSPPGSVPTGPSPLCAPLTPSSESFLAQIRHSAGSLSLVEDLLYNIIPQLEDVQSTVVQQEELMFEVDMQIADQSRAAVERFAEHYLGTVIPGLEDVAEKLGISLESLGSDTTSTLTTLGQLIDEGEFSHTAYLSSLYGVSRERLVPGRPSGIRDSVLRCVDRQRGGADPRFSFFVSDEGVSGDGGEEGAGGSRRQLLSSTFSGYPVLNTKATSSYNMVPWGRHSTGVRRRVGLRGKQQVLAGATLYQYRRSPDSLVPGGERHSKLCGDEGLGTQLSSECESARVESILDSLDFLPPGPLPIGVDPAFSNQSALFNPVVAARPEAWYNTSQEAGEVNAEGIPFGFFPESPPGLPTLFPIVFDINLDEAAMRNHLRYLIDGAFLDARGSTTGLEFKMATYDADLQLYGYISFKARWTDAGLVDVDIKIEALENRDYSLHGLKSPGMPNRLANDVVLLFLVVVYVGLTVEDIRKSIKAQQRRKYALADLEGRGSLASGALLPSPSQQAALDPSEYALLDEPVWEHELKRGMQGGAQAGAGSLNQYAEIAPQDDTDRVTACIKTGRGSASEDPPLRSVFQGYAPSSRRTSSSSSTSSLGRASTPLEPSRPALVSPPLKPRPKHAATVPTLLQQHDHQHDPTNHSSLSPPSPPPDRNPLTSPTHPPPPTTPSKRPLCRSKTTLSGPTLAQPPHLTQLHHHHHHQTSPLLDDSFPSTPMHLTTTPPSPDPARADPPMGELDTFRYNLRHNDTFAEDGSPHAHPPHQPTPPTQTAPPCPPTHCTALPGGVLLTPSPPSSFTSAGTHTRPNPALLSPISHTIYHPPPTHPTPPAEPQPPAPSPPPPARLGSQKSQPAHWNVPSFVAMVPPQLRSSRVAPLQAHTHQHHSRDSGLHVSGVRNAYAVQEHSARSVSFCTPPPAAGPVGESLGDTGRGLSVGLQPAGYGSKGLEKDLKPQDVSMGHQFPWSDSESGSEASQAEDMGGSAGTSDTEADVPPDPICIDDHPILGKLRAVANIPRRHQRFTIMQQGEVYRGSMSSFWIVYETVLCLFMIAAIILLYYYALKLQPEHAPRQRRIKVYDSLNAPARPLMLKRNTSTLDGGDGVPTPLPGTENRWKQGTEDETGLYEVVNMYQTLEDMSNIQTIYSLIQGFAFVLLMTRFIIQTSFQPKLSLISGTLALATPDILYFIFTVTTAGVMIAACLVVVFGTQGFPHVSNLTSALVMVARGIITGDNISDAFPEFLARQAQGSSLASNAAYRALAWVFILIRPLLFIFMLVIVMAILMTPYARLRIGAAGAPGVHHDCAALLRWMRDYLRGQLSMNELRLLLDVLLNSRQERRKSEEVQALRRKQSSKKRSPGRSLGSSFWNSMKRPFTPAATNQVPTPPAPHHRPLKHSPATPLRSSLKCTSTLDTANTTCGDIDAVGPQAFTDLQPIRQPPLPLQGSTDIDTPAADSAAGGTLPQPLAPPPALLPVRTSAGSSTARVRSTPAQLSTSWNGSEQGPEQCVGFAGLPASNERAPSDGCMPAEGQHPECAANRARSQRRLTSVNLRFSSDQPTELQPPPEHAASTAPAAQQRSTSVGLRFSAEQPTILNSQYSASGRRRKPPQKHASSPALNPSHHTHPPAHAHSGFPHHPTVGERPASPSVRDFESPSVLGVSSSRNARRTASLLGRRPRSASWLHGSAERRSSLSISDDDSSHSSSSSSSTQPQHPALDRTEDNGNKRQEACPPQPLFTRRNASWHSSPADLHPPGSEHQHQHQNHYQHHQHHQHQLALLQKAARAFTTHKHHTSSSLSSPSPSTLAPSLSSAYPHSQHQPPSSRPLAQSRSLHYPESGAHRHTAHGVLQPSHSLHHTESGARRHAAPGVLQPSVSGHGSRALGPSESWRSSQGGLEGQMSLRGMMSGHLQASSKRLSSPTTGLGSLMRSAAAFKQKHATGSAASGKRSSDPGSPKRGSDAGHPPPIGTPAAAAAAAAVTGRAAAQGVPEVDGQAADAHARGSAGWMLPRRFWGLPMQLSRALRSSRGGQPDSPATPTTPTQAARGATQPSPPGASPQDHDQGDLNFNSLRSSSEAGLSLKWAKHGDCDGVSSKQEASAKSTGDGSSSDDGELSEAESEVGELPAQASARAESLHRGNLSGKLAAEGSECSLKGTASRRLSVRFSAESPPKGSASGKLPAQASGAAPSPFAGSVSGKVPVLASERGGPQPHSSMEGGEAGMPGSSSSNREGAGDELVQRTWGRIRAVLKERQKEEAVQAVKQAREEQAKRARMFFGKAGAKSTRVRGGLGSSRMLGAGSARLGAIQGAHAPIVNTSGRAPPTGPLPQSSASASPFARLASSKLTSSSAAHSSPNPFRKDDTAMCQPFQLPWKAQANQQRLQQQQQQQQQPKPQPQGHAAQHQTLTAPASLTHMGSSRRASQSRGLFETGGLPDMGRASSLQAWLEAQASDPAQADSSAQKLVVIGEQPPHDHHHHHQQQQQQQQCQRSSEGQQGAGREAALTRILWRAVADTEQCAAMVRQTQAASRELQALVQAVHAMLCARGHSQAPQAVAIQPLPGPLVRAGGDKGSEGRGAEKKGSDDRGLDEGGSEGGGFGVKALEDRVSGEGRASTPPSFMPPIPPQPTSFPREASASEAAQPASSPYLPTSDALATDAGDAWSTQVAEGQQEMELLELQSLRSAQQSLQLPQLSSVTVRSSRSSTHQQQQQPRTQALPPPSSTSRGSWLSAQQQQKQQQQQQQRGGAESGGLWASKRTRTRPSPVQAQVGSSSGGQDPCASPRHDPVIADSDSSSIGDDESDELQAPHVQDSPQLRPHEPLQPRPRGLPRRLASSVPRELMAAAVVPAHTSHVSLRKSDAGPPLPPMVVSPRHPTPIEEQQPLRNIQTLPTTTPPKKAALQPFPTVRTRVDAAPPHLTRSMHSVRGAARHGTSEAGASPDTTAATHSTPHRPPRAAWGMSGEQEAARGSEDGREVAGRAGGQGAVGRESVRRQGRGGVLSATGEPDEVAIADDCS